MSAMNCASMWGVMLRTRITILARAIKSNDRQLEELYGRLPLLRGERNDRDMLIKLCTYCRSSAPIVW